MVNAMRRKFYDVIGIDGKVALVKPYCVVINRGSEQGVVPNMVFILYHNIAVNDPDTDEYLGTVKNKSNIKLTANTVHPLLTIMSYDQDYSHRIQIGDNVMSIGYWTYVDDECEPTPEPGWFRRLTGI